MKRQDATVINLSFLNSYSILEDEIYLRIDKLQALCAAKTLLHESDTVPPPGVCFHYTKVMEEQVVELRKLVDNLFTSC